MTTDLDDDNDAGGSFTQHVVSAADAPALKGLGPASVFHLADSGFHVAEQTSKPPAPQAALSGALGHTLLLVAEAGEMTPSMLALAEGITRTAAQQRMCKLVNRGLLVRLRKDGVYTVFGPAPHGVAPAAGQASASKPARVQAAAGTAALKASTPLEPASELVCGLLNNGELILETPFDGSLRLTRADTRRLVAYLDLVSAAITAEA